VMICDSLRKSVLQAAMQGRLTKQLESDGNAADLLNSIKAEQERLASDKKAGKRTVLSAPSNDEVPFEIPENWKWVRMGDIILDDIGGGTPDKSNPQYWGSEIPWMSVKDFSNARNGVVSDTIDHITRVGVENSTTNVIEPGAIILCTRVGLGKFASNAVPVAINQDLRAIWLAKHIDRGFFLRFYSSLSIRGTGTTVKGIKRDELMAILVPLPPLAEQHRIVDGVDGLMAKIDDLQIVENELEAMKKVFPSDMKKALLMQAIQGKLTEQLESDGDASTLFEEVQQRKDRLVGVKPSRGRRPSSPIPDDAIPFDIPSNWLWCRIGDIALVNPRNKADDDMLASFVPMTLLHEGYGSAFAFEIRTWKSMKCGFTHFADGDVVMAKITPCFQNLKSAVIGGLENGIGAGTTELHVFRVVSDTIDRKYLLYFLKNPRLIADGLKSVYGTAGQQRISTDFIAQYPLPLPPLAEQHRIVARVDELMARIDELQIIKDEPRAMI
jgi:type I restriction enzyme S subunit